MENKTSHREREEERGRERGRKREREEERGRERKRLEEQQIETLPRNGLHLKHRAPHSTE